MAAVEHHGFWVLRRGPERGVVHQQACITVHYARRWLPRRCRQNILEAIDNRIAAAKVDANGEPFELRGMRWVKDPETDERVHKEMSLRQRRWWWKDEKFD